MIRQGLGPQIVWFFAMFVLAAVFIPPAGGPAEAQSTPQESDSRVPRGRAIADKICWACHVISSDQEFSPILREPGPDFHTIANRRDTTAQSLSAFLRTTHRTEGKLYTMPDPRLTDDMIGAVASYIMSLRDHP